LLVCIAEHKQKLAITPIIEIVSRSDRLNQSLNKFYIKFKADKKRAFKLYSVRTISLI